MPMFMSRLLKEPAGYRSKARHIQDGLWNVLRLGNKLVFMSRLFQWPKMGSFEL